MALVVINHVSLDGVMQAPARADEDTRGGFDHGGWAVDSTDPQLGVLLGEAMGQNFSWLFGRRSYDDMLTHWNAVGGPFKEGLNAAHKYVVSSNPQLDLPWPNSSQVSGDVPSAVRSLKGEAPGNLVVMGSGQLVRSLLDHGLVDELVVLVNPVVLGSGRRLFAEDGPHTELTVERVVTTDDGLVAVRYRLPAQE